MGRLGRLGLESAERYERAVAGELIHIDVKKLGRIVGGAGHRITGPRGRRSTGSFTDAAGRRRNKAGWDFVHIAIDDATRLAYAEVLADEKATTAIAFLRRAIAFFNRHGMTVRELLTDNGSPYISTIHAIACRALGIRHLRTRPRRPQTNGKGLCLKISGPSEVAARLPAPVGLTQAKACRRSRFLLNRRWRREPFSWPAFDLSTGGLRAGRRR
jgi:transposase InsO family protein